MTAKAAGSGLSRIRSFFFWERDLTLAQRSKLQEAGRVVQPRLTFLRRPRPSPAKVSHPPPPPKEGPASKFSGYAWGKVHEALHGYSHLTHFGCESMPDAPRQEVNQSQGSAGGV